MRKETDKNEAKPEIPQEKDIGRRFMVLAGGGGGAQRTDAAPSYICMYVLYIALVGS